jgi:hypothetical protein
MVLRGYERSRGGAVFGPSQGVLVVTPLRTRSTSQFIGGYFDLLALCAHESPSLTMEHERFTVNPSMMCVRRSLFSVNPSMMCVRRSLFSLNPSTMSVKSELFVANPAMLNVRRQGRGGLDAAGRLRTLST